MFKQEKCALIKKFSFDSNTKLLKAMLGEVQKIVIFSFYCNLSSRSKTPQSDDW
jgi:hypothetical protein